MGGSTKCINRRHRQSRRGVDDNDIEIPREPGIGELSRQRKAGIFLAFTENKGGKKLVLDIGQFERCANQAQIREWCCSRRSDLTVMKHVIAFAEENVNSAISFFKSRHDVRGKRHG